MANYRRWAWFVLTLAAACVSAAGAAALNPPFSGTAYLSTNIITAADWSAYETMTYAGQAPRWVFDRRVNQWLFQPMYLFDATFADGLTAEVQVNPEFGNQSAAAVQAANYATIVGRLPTSVRLDVQSITLHKGVMPFGGGNNNILIHTDQAVQYGEYIEEVLFHEATHTSYDADHATSLGWVAAQQADPTYISTYAEDNPSREDVAESLLPWYALRYTDALYPFQIDAINTAIPNRLAYFDALPFQLNEPPLFDNGDFNDDDVIDAADYTVWRNGLGSTYTPEDYDLWKSHFGESIGPGSGSASSFANVPEPAAFTLLISLGCTCLLTRSRQADFIWRPALES